MVCQGEILISKISGLYSKISSLESLKPSQEVDSLFTDLVNTCMPPCDVDVTKLQGDLWEMRCKLIRICGEAEGLLESHFATILGEFDNPIDHFAVFPYYSNYLKLGHLEYTLLSEHYPTPPKKVAFVGSGPLPFTSVVLALKYLTTTTFHNFDMDPSANSKAIRLVSSHPDLSRRMQFHTTDIMKVTGSLRDFDVVFLAALVGMTKEEKVRIMDHLAMHMEKGTILMLRSAHAARGFLYPVIDPTDLRGFEVLSVFHPTDEVINSVIVARKSAMPDQIQCVHSCNFRVSSCACFGKNNFNRMVDELAIED